MKVHAASEASQPVWWDYPLPSDLVSHVIEGQSVPLAGLGDIGILKRRKLALLCSVRCPGSVIVKSYDLVQRLREGGFALVGGFHTPMEKEWLRVLLRGPAPVIVCPARGIEGMRVPAEYRGPIREGRLLVLSCFPGGPDRPTRAMAEERNRFVAALADAVLVAHAAPGGKTEGVCREVVARGGRAVPVGGLGERAPAGFGWGAGQPVQRRLVPRAGRPRVGRGYGRGWMPATSTLADSRD